MSKVEPAWKKRTRPCIYYSQGRCLFADSCNFLHDDNLKAIVAPGVLEQSRTSYRPSSVPTVHGLAGVRPSSAVHSPPRSPRMSNLLSALEDIIGPDDADSLLEIADTVVATVRPSRAQELPASTLAGSARHNAATYRSSSNSDSGCGSSDEKRSPSYLLLTEPPPQPPHHAATTFSSARTHSEATEQAISANAQSARSRPDSAPFHLLSPVELAYGMPLAIPFPHLEHDDAPQREDSVDSGYAETWAGPLSLSLSPPPRIHPTSTFDLLSSPFGSPSKRILSTSSRSPIPSPSVRAIYPRKTGSIESVDDDVPSLSLRGAEPIYRSESDIMSDSLELNRSQPLSMKDNASVDHDHATAPADNILQVSNTAHFDADISWEDSFSSNVSHERLSFPIPPTSLPVPHRNPEPRDVTQDALPLAAPSFSARFSLAQVMKDSLVERAARAQREWSIAADPPAEVAEEAEHSDSQAHPAHTLPLALDTARPDSTRLSSTPMLAYLDAPTDTYPAAASPVQPVLLSQEPQPLLASTETVELEQDDTITGMYDSYKFSPEQAAAKRMSWVTSSRAMSPVSNTSSSRSQSPLPDNAVHPGPSTLSFSALDDYERVLEAELAQDDMDTNVRSRARVHTASPPSASSRPGSRLSSRGASRPSSSASQRVFRRPGSLLVPRDDITDGRLPSPLSLTGEVIIQEVVASHRARSSEGVRVASPVSTSSARSESKWDTVGKSKKVPFGFRNSFKGKPIHTRSRPSITATDSSTTSHRDLAEGIGRASSAAASEPPVSAGLRPFRLSRSLDSSILLLSSRRTSPALSNYSHSQGHNESTASSPSTSLSQPHLLSSTSLSSIPTYTNGSLHLDTHHSLHSSGNRSHHEPPMSAPPQSWRTSTRSSDRSYVRSPITPRSSSRLSEPVHTVPEDGNTSDSSDGFDATVNARRPLPVGDSPRTAPTPTTSYDAPSTPAPTLMFAIASDDPEAVRAVLEKGDANPDTDFGPQSALAFALTNGQLSHRIDIVKTLLAYGADPASLRDPARNPPHREDAERDGMFVSPPPETSLESMDPATKYYISRADAAHTRRSSALVRRSFFRPLTRARYDIVGQDRVFEQLFLALNLHSRTLSVSPMVVLLCGPSGHGKSFLARKFASLLLVPAHTVNVTTLRSTHDIWQSHSMSPYEEPSNCTLAQFLLENEGKRCVVVLDEIEKTNDPKVLYPLLMPWELGRCSLKAGERHVDVRNVIWIGTSNVGHDLVLEYECTTPIPDSSMSRDDYLKLIDLLRPRVSDCLGASLVSRVTAVLPFVPFTVDEQMAVATEALYSLGGQLATQMDVPAIEEIARTALERYLPAEGARSIYRAVSALLLSMSDYSNIE